MRGRLPVAIALLSVAMPAASAERTVTMRIDNMTCAACPIIVRTAVGKVEAVSSVEVDIASKTAVVVFDDSLAQTTDLADASLNAGFPAVILE